MSQYKTGSVTVTNGSPTILGSGTLFVANVPVGSVFSVTASGVPYIVGAVPDDTHLTLTSNYAGSTLAGQSYACTTSFTPNQQLAYPEQKDIDTPTILKRSMVKLDTLLGAAFGASGQASRVVFTDASGNLTTSANATLDSSGNLVVAGTLSNTGTTANIGNAGGSTVTFGTAGGGNNYAYARSSGGKIGFWAGGQTNIVSDTTGYISIQTGHGFAGSVGAEQVRVNHTASATRFLTLTGSNGGNPQLGVSAGVINTTCGMNWGSQTTGQPSVQATNDDAANPSFTFVSDSGTGMTRLGATILGFSTGSTERARISAAGFLKRSNDGTYAGSTGQFHEDRCSVGGSVITYSTHTHASNPFGWQLDYTADPNGTSNEFLLFRGNSTTRGYWRSNGGIGSFSANNVNLSDARSKVGLQAAPSYWDFIERLSSTLKRGSYADDASAKVHTFLVAQEVEKLDAGLISAWRHSPLAVMKGITEHEIQMRLLGVVGEIQRELRAMNSPRFRLAA